MLRKLRLGYDASVLPLYDKIGLVVKSAQRIVNCVSVTCREQEAQLASETPIPSGEAMVC